MMNFNPYQGYQGQYFGYTQAMPDQLSQLRQQGSMQQNQPFPQSQTQTPDERIWVQGEAAGKSYLVAPGNTVPLWDSERQTIYLKSVDASGIPTMRILDYAERTQSMPAPGVEYVTRAEYDALAKKVEALIPKEEVSNE